MRAINASKKTILKIINKFINLMVKPDFRNNKLGGPGVIVQLDETMINFKCKSHRGRASTNKTDAFCIVEFKGCITRAFAVVIPDKKSSTLIPIIMQQVANGSKIWTDELSSYRCIRHFNYIHGTVCHKYEFINSETGVNTQAIESFNSQLKYEIKVRKGVQTTNRSVFLCEFCFYFNNRDDFFNAIINLLKV
jgi:transposase-like protein